MYKRARGIPVYWGMEDKKPGRKIEVLQLTKYIDLINESRATHNCVASYHQRCSQNSSYIFSLRIDGVRQATIEVRGDAAVQARVSRNRSLSDYPLHCLRKWTAKFNLAEDF